MRPLTPRAIDALRQIVEGHHEISGVQGGVLVRRGLAEEYDASLGTVGTVHHRYYRAWRPTDAGVALAEAVRAEERAALEARRAAQGTVSVPVWALRKILPPERPAPPGDADWPWRRALWEAQAALFDALDDPPR